MNKIYKSVLGVAAMSIVAGASIAPASVFAQGDSANGRQTYTLEQINNNALGNTITFNSITNGKIGDERNFVGAKLSSDTNNVWKADSIDVKDGEVYTIRLYVHNNSPKGEYAVAEGVSASFSLPTTVSKSQTIKGYISATNATPTRYWDEVVLNSSEDIYLEYVEGSARWTNSKLGTVVLNDNVITSGATIGYNDLDGKIPGCYEFDGQVTIQVRVHSSVSSKLSKKVRIKGTTTWSESVNAKVGDEVEYQIEYVNLNAATAENVMIRDILPTNMEYVADSTYLFNASHQNGVQLKDNTVTTSGINIGSYKAQGNAYVQFTAKVVNKTLTCGNNQLVNWASSTVNSVVSKDDASVFVNAEENCKKKDNDKETPVDNNDTVIPSTGPAEFAGVALAAGSIVTAGGYFIASRKKA